MNPRHAMTDMILHESQKDILENTEIEYRGCIIKPDRTGWLGKNAVEWEHPDYLDYEWDADGWVSFACGTANSLEEAKQDIDDFLENLV